MTDHDVRIRELESINERLCDLLIRETDKLHLLVDLLENALFAGQSCGTHSPCSVGHKVRVALNSVLDPGISAPSCSCPSGDGSLRHPCRVHPSN